MGDILQLQRQGGGYSPVEREQILAGMTLLVDTREQETAALSERLLATGLPWERQKLSFGDYSCAFTPLQGERVSLAEYVAIERKMNLDELCACFTSGRGRFEREMLRAKVAGARLYLLVENASWERVLGGKYHSRMTPTALAASLLSWQARYNLRVVFCGQKESGVLIGKILRYECKVFLEADVNTNYKMEE